MAEKPEFTFSTLACALFKEFYARIKISDTLQNKL